MDGERNQQAGLILRAAAAEFARWGKAGARIDAIATAAGVNKRLLYHYVGDKQALFQAAVAAAQAALAAGDSPVAGDPPASQDLPGAEHSPVGEHSAALTPEAQSWLLLVQGAAADADTDFSALGERIRRESATSEQAMLRTGLELLVHLLPGLAESLLDAAPADAGRVSVVEAADRARALLKAAERPKPRIKLKPELSAGQALRSDSNSSK